MTDKNIALLDSAGAATGAELAVVIQDGQPVLMDIDAIAARTDLSGKADASALAGYLPTSQKSAANGLAPLGSDSKVPSTYLPSYVDDVIEAASFAAFPVTGETGKIYIDTSSTPAAAYRWTGSAYSVIGGTPQYASQAEAVAGTENTKTMTSLRVAQQVDPKLALKADKLTTVTVSVGGNYDLTEAAHNGRRVVAAVAGVVFTRTTTWSASAVGAFLDVDADGSFTLGTGITVPSGCASSSATAAGGAVDLACVDGALKSITAANATVSAGVTIYKVAPAVDISPGVADVDVLLFEQVITGLTALSEIEATIRMLGVGAGNKYIKLLIGGTAGASDGTPVAFAAAAVSQRQNIGLLVNGDASGVIGISPNIVSYGTTTTANIVVAQAGITAGLRVKLVGSKSAGADTLTYQGGQVRVYA